MGKLFANNGDPDQTPRSVASDQVCIVGQLPIKVYPDYNGLKFQIVVFQKSNYAKLLDEYITIFFFIQSWMFCLATTRRKSKNMRRKQF